MPNWCFNSVTVSAKTEAELVEFLDFCDKPHTSNHYDYQTDTNVLDENDKGVFWNFITPPAEILDEYFASQSKIKISASTDFNSSLPEIKNKLAVSNHWYEWNVRNWGTKWDIALDREYLTLDQRNDSNWYFNWSFDTAWSPAVETYDAMAERFPNLEFEFEITEEANFFAGKLHYAGGVLVSDQFVDNPTHADFMALDIPCTSCVWGEVDEYTTQQILTLSKEQLEEESEYLNDDCPFRLLAEKRIAELEAAE